MTPGQKYENDKLDIDYLTASDIDLGDSIPVADTSDSNLAKKLQLSRLLNMTFPAQGRLTLESGVPCSSSNQTAKTTLYYTPYLGNWISIYDGTRWVLHSFSELSLNISTYTASKPYDIWIYSNSGSATLDSTIWTNDTTRATSLALQDGIYVKSGDSTRRYLGTIRITGTTGQCEDSMNNRFVWNYYNRIKRIGMCCNTTYSWTYATSAWRECNGGTGSLRFYFVIGVKEVLIQLEQSCNYQSASAAAGYVGVVDSTGQAWYQGYYSGSYYPLYGRYGTCAFHPEIGVSSIYPREYSNSATAMTLYGTGSTTSVNYVGGHQFIEG